MSRQIQVTFDAHDDVITRAIVELAGTLGLLTVAEGVETAQQSETVAALGCDIAQGYHFSRPVTAEVLDGILAEVGTIHDGDETTVRPR